MKNQTQPITPPCIPPEAITPYGTCIKCHQPIWTSFVEVPARYGSYAVRVHASCYAEPVAAQPVGEK